MSSEFENLPYIQNHPLIGKMVKVNLEENDHIGKIDGVYGEKSEETNVIYYRASISFNPPIQDMDDDDIAGCDVPLNFCEIM